MVAMITIILAEDHKTVRELLSSMLAQDERFEDVADVKDGHAALAEAERLKPDVLVTDLRLPGLDGIEVAKRIPGVSPGTKTVLISMYSDEAHVYDSLAAGARGYVVKSSVENLPEAIVKVAGGELYLSPPLSIDSIESYRLRYRKPALPITEDSSI